MDGDDYLPRLQVRLEELPDDSDAMLIDELDGFIAGLLLRPAGSIRPSIWMPEVWGACGGVGKMVPFADFAHMQSLMDVVADHYNAVATSLDRTNYSYQPIFVEEHDGSIEWRDWIHGFGRAVDLCPEGWRSLADPATGTTDMAFSQIMRIRTIGEDAPDQADEDLGLSEHMIPTAIAGHVRRIASVRRRPFAANDDSMTTSGRRLVGRSGFTGILGRRLAHKLMRGGSVLSSTSRDVSMPSVGVHG